MIREFCAENATDVGRALALGAQRVELCDNLAVGGTTPSKGVIEQVCQLANQQGARVMTMIRPRAGNFCYDEMEKTIMQTDMSVAREAGSHGLVLGMLTEGNWLDEEALRYMIAEYKDMELVFHMAFDAISRSRQKEALDWLVEEGFTRILTHGGRADVPIGDHIEWLKELVTYAAGRIEILVGGGVNKNNYQEICQLVGTDQAHGTKIV